MKCAAVSPGKAQRIRQRSSRRRECNRSGTWRQKKDVSSGYWPRFGVPRWRPAAAWARPVSLSAPPGPRRGRFTDGGFFIEPVDALARPAAAERVAWAVRRVLPEGDLPPRAVVFA